MRFVSPESFTFFESVIILCMVILGGMGSIAGVILGAVILVVLPEALRGFAPLQNARPWCRTGSDDGLQAGGYPRRAEEEGRVEAGG